MATTRVWAIQHIECETAGTIADALEASGIALRTVGVYKGEPIPKELGAAGGLVVMGGPMGVYEADRYPFLSEEIRLIERAVKAEKPVLGVCLGSQLLAKALGASVTKGKVLWASRASICHPFEKSGDSCLEGGQVWLQGAGKELKGGYMARIKEVTEDGLPFEVKETFEEQKKRFGSVLNTAKVYALRPTIYKGVQALGKGIQDSGLIEPELRHLVCVKAASINGCPY